MNKIRIGVIGLNFGKHHVRTLANMENAELVAIADLTSVDLNTFASKYNAKPYRDGLEMMEREKLDAVTIATSPKFRTKLITHAAENHIAMFVEKPWAVNLEHAQKLADICRNYNATVMVAFSFRYHPAIVKLRSLMDGALGTGLLLNGEYIFGWVPPSEHWLWDPANGNGFFNENSCHLFDAVNFLLGEPVSLSAEAISPLQRPTAQGAVVTLRYANGAIACLSIGCLGAGAFHDFPRIDIKTTYGQASLSGRDHIWESLTWATRDELAAHQIIAPPEALGNTRYTYAMQHFIDCVRNGSPPLSCIEDGVKTVAMAMAVYEAARTGQKIKLTW
jgi:predicted dehydrogenase